MLHLARDTGAKLLQASTSEVYGDPAISPQKEDYWGNVNPIGIRSCYDEGKRAAETLCFDYLRQYEVDARVIRIFNTYGPNMELGDGRVVSNFIVQALRNKPITIYGDGSQTRSFCYVSDLIDGISKVISLDENPGSPVNLGNPTDFTMLELAQVVLEVTKSDSEIDRKVALGRPQLYLIGSNEVTKVSDDLYPFLQFDLDEEETRKRGVVVYSSNKERVLKSRPQLDWLFDGDYVANNLSISNYTPKYFEPSGGIKGKLINLSGVWQDGSFKGIMSTSGSKILGGRIIDGIFMGEADGFQISPWNFWSGGFSPMKNFVLGMPIAKDNTKYKKLSIFQVPSDKIIKIIAPILFLKIHVIKSNVVIMKALTSSNKIIKFLINDFILNIYCKN
jgi:hypothetical protein